MNKRIIPFDILRTMAAFAVVLLHSSCQYFDNVLANDWIVRCIYDASVRWCVPVFIMISGALFLNLQKDIKIHKLYTSNISHILCAFFFWSLLYALYETRVKINPLYLYENILYGPPHLWFLKMLLGLYLSIPIFRVVVSDKHCERYFLGLTFLFTFLVPLFFPFLNGPLQSATRITFSYPFLFDLKIIIGYSVYFVWGHYLTTYRLDKITKRSIYVLSVLSFFFVTIITYFFSNSKGVPYETFFEYLNPCTFFEASSIFIFVTNMTNDIGANGKFRGSSLLRHNIPYYIYKIIIKLSRYCLGIYLSHILIIKLVYDYLRIDSSSYNSLIFIPCYSFFIFSTSAIIACILYKIPYLNKTIV